MARSRRLLVVAQPTVAGVPRHVLELVRAAASEGWVVDVACPKDSELWAGLCDDSRVTLHRFTPHRRPAVADASASLRLVPLIRRADVIHAHSSKAGVLVRTAAALLGARRRVVFTPHGWSFWAVHGIERRAYGWLESFMARWCAAIIAVSEAERAAGLETGVGSTDRYWLIPNGVDTDGFGTWSPVSGRVVMVARLAPPKRPDLAIQAIALVRQDVPDAELHLVGDGPGRDAAVELARDLGVANAVRFRGACDDVPVQLASAACFLLATDYEAASMSVLEAMAAGVPIVATDVPSIREQLGADAGIVAAPTPRAIATAVSTLLSDPNLGSEMGAAGRRRSAQRFSRDAMVRAVLVLYDQIASGQGPADQSG